MKIPGWIALALMLGPLAAQTPDEVERRRAVADLERLRVGLDADLAARRARVDALKAAISALAPEVDRAEASVVEQSSRAEVGALRLPADEAEANAAEAALREASAAARRLDDLGPLDAAISRASRVRRDGRVLHLGTLVSIEALEGDRAYLTYPTRPQPVGPVDVPGLSALLDGWESNPAWVPIEATGRIKASDVRARRDFAGWVAAGGPVVVLILIVGGLALIVALVRWFALLAGRPVEDSVVAAARALIDRGDLSSARAALTAAGPEGGHLAAAVDGVASARGEDRRTRVDVALDAAGLRHEKAATFVAAAAGITPLLGLLGTVMGMITTFEGVGGGGVDRSAMLSRGISEALITTEAGLMFAIPLLLLHALITARAERLAATFEDQLGILLPPETP